MSAKCVLYLLLHVIWTITAQHNPYSLQTAVDALHHRETQLALKDYENSRSGNSEPSGYFEPLPDVSELQKQQELNQLLTRYLDNDDDQAREAYGPEFENGQYMDERKRSMFRERDDSPYQSVFREREVIQPDLAAEFLKEIDRERNAEREEKYKETLRRLWEKYQQQENEIEEDLFTDDKPNQMPAYEMKMVAPRPQYISAENRPEYFGSVVEKRRLILPWMPATRRKRFPVAKRSPKYTKDEAASTSGTDAKVAKDLQAIFDEPIEMKKKRSSGNEQRSTSTTAVPTMATATITTHAAATTAHHIEKKSDHSTRSEETESHSHEHDHNNNHDLDHDGDLEEHAHEHDHEHDHEHEHDHDEDEDEDDFDDDEDDDKKKKRAVAEAKRSNPEILKEDQIIPGDLNDFRRKKSVQWSKYFGIDRRKKSVDWFANNSGSQAKPETLDDYAPKHFRNHDQMVSRPSLELNDKKLDNMDQKLKTIEDLIIDETIKYTGAHEGITNPEDIQRLKDHVISRLATAYSLEKMRRALDKLKQSVDNERHLKHNEIDSVRAAADGNEDYGAVDKAKRVAIKKEKVQFDNNHHAIETTQPEKVVHDVANNALELAEDDKKKKKKKSLAPHQYTATDYNELKHLAQQRPPYTDYNEMGEFEGDDGIGGGHFEPMNEGYMGGAREVGVRAGECPLLDAMEKRCKGIDLLSGDIHQDLLPVCGIHQICYLCGTSQLACDMQYLSEADALCGHSKECESAARSALMILRGTPGPQLGPKECGKNRCLYQAMREIGGI